MKKILALILTISLTLLCFASCGSKDKDEDEYKISDFEENLEDAGYTVESIEDSEEISEMFEDLGLENDDYKVKAILSGVNMSSLNVVVVIKCSSSSNAKKLKSDMNEASAELGEIMGDMEIKAEGSFVILGSDSAIDAALGK